MKLSSPLAIVTVRIELTPDTGDRNLTLPFAEIIETLQGVRNGKFDEKIRVTSNDGIDTFCHPLVNENDVTLVVVKVDA